MKKKASSIFLIIILLAGLSLLLYPTFSDYWNSFHQSQAISSYIEEVANIDNVKYDEILSAAKKYNTDFERESLWVLSEDEMAAYESQLDVSGNGIMGYVEIPTIKCTLPVYHGTEESILQVAAGHIEGSSLPVGGLNTHCVISGHRGLPSAKLFTNLDQLVVGDLFMLHVLDEVFTYEVDQIRIVEPDDLTQVKIEEGMDLCTLVTCTPYGVNSHRLLVRGKRVENVYVPNVRVSADAMQIEHTVVSLVVSGILLIPLLMIALIVRRFKR